MELEVGHISRDNNEIIARLITTGKLIYGKIKSKEEVSGG